GVDLRTDTEVQADRLEDHERRAGRVDVSSRQHSEVLLDDGRGGIGDLGGLVLLDRGPFVVAVLGEERGRVDVGQGLLDVGDDVRHILLVQDHVGTSADPSHMAAYEVLPRVGHGRVRGGDGAGDVLIQIEAVERHPAGQIDVDQHQRVMVGKVDVDVVGGVVG